MEELRKIPHNDEIEKYVLSCMFFPSGDSGAEYAITKCRNEYFYKSKNGILFSAIRRIVESGKSVDMLTVHDEMTSEELDAIGGPLYITEIAHAADTTARIKQHMSTLREYAKERKIVTAALTGDYNTLRSAVEYIDRNYTEQDESLVIPFGEISRDTVEYYKNGGDPGESCGYELLDKFYRVAKKQFTVVTGTPSSGKSEIIDQFMINLARYSDWNFIIYSPENFPLPRHVRKLVQKYSRFPFFDGYTQRLSSDDLRESLDFIDRHFDFIYSEEFEITLEMLLDQVAAICAKKDIHGLVIDPWNEVLHILPDGVTETEYISRALRKIRNFARQHNIHIWIVAHPTKLRKLDSGIYPVATPYDISGSANWYNKADNCLSVYLNTKSGNVDLYVQKIRFQDNGQRGSLSFRWSKTNGTYEELNEDTQEPK